jgi:hypothetical protein
VNRLADATSPYLLQHAKASLATPTEGGCAGYAGATVWTSLATPTERGCAGYAGATVWSVLQ